MQLVGTDHRLGVLRGPLAAVATGHQLGADRSGQDFMQRGAGLCAQPSGSRDPSNEVLDQGFGHAGVDVVVRHLVADAVGAPSKRKLAQVAGADHQRIVEVGEAE